MELCTVRCATGFVLEHQEMVLHKLTHGEQVDQVQECVVVDLVYQVTHQHTQEKLLLCPVIKEYVDV
jgi:hypothetical protein